MLFYCPLCKLQLEKKESAYHCSRCNQSFPVHYDIPDFLPQELEKVKQIEVETYTYRADQFKETEAIKVGRKEFTTPLRNKGQNSLFLELCGGSAHHALLLMKDGYKVVESDIAPGSVFKAKQFARQLKIDHNGTFAVIDAESLPFAKNAFDGIFLIASLHHLPHPQKALLEIKRVLKPDGILLIGYEPNTWQYYLFYPFFKFFRYLIRKRSNHPISLADDETFGFSKSKLKKLIQKSGLKLIRVSPVDFWQMFYQKGIELTNKLFKTNCKINEKWQNKFKRLDKFIFQIPFMDLLALNYDIEAKKVVE